MNLSILFLDQISGSGGAVCFLLISLNLDKILTSQFMILNLCGDFVRQIGKHTLPPHMYSNSLDPFLLSLIINTSLFIPNLSILTKYQIRKSTEPQRQKNTDTSLFSLRKFVPMEVLDHDDLFYADISKQISLLIMEDDDDIHLPVSAYRHPSASLQVHTIIFFALVKSTQFCIVFYCLAFSIHA